MLTQWKLVISVALAVMLFPLSTMATPVAIRSLATGSKTPEQAPQGSTLINGDFIIQNWGNNTGPVGDGVDDVTTWVFDFSTDPNYTEFANWMQAGKPFRVTMGMKLIPGNVLISTDFVQVDGLGQIGGCVECIPVTVSPNPGHQDGFGGLAVGEEGTAGFVLTDYYSQEDFAEYFLNNFGRVVVQSADDAIIFQSGMQVSAVPEPSTFMLMGGGLFSLFGVTAVP